VRAGCLGVPYSAQTWMVVYCQHFVEADFTSPECIHLNRMVIPTVCATSAHSHSASKQLYLSEFVTLDGKCSYICFIHLLTISYNVDSFVECKSIYIFYVSKWPRGFNFITSLSFLV
jgi:hypothetical protein